MNLSEERRREQILILCVRAICGVALAAMISLTALNGSAPIQLATTATAAANPTGGPFAGIWTDVYDQGSLNDLGAGWTTALVPWSTVEPQHNVYNWNALDATFVAASNGGRRQILAAVTFTPSWVGPTACQVTSAQERAFLAEFMAAVVGRYSGRNGPIPSGPSAGQTTNVKYWALYNEVNNTNQQSGALYGGCFGTLDGGGRPTSVGPTNYARVIADVGPAIHTADPDAKVVFSGMPSAQFIGSTIPGSGCAPTSTMVCPFDVNFFTESLQALKQGVGGLNQLDAAMVNYFSSESVGWGYENFGVDLVGRINEFRQEMRNAGLSEAELKPILVQEASYTDPFFVNGVPQAPVSTADPTYGYNIGQRDYVTRVLARAASLNLIAIEWFKLQDTSGGGPGAEAPFGLLTTTGSPKPSYLAYRYFTRLIDRQDRFVGAVTFSVPRLEGYEFNTADGRHVRIVWRNRDPLNPNDVDTQVPYNPTGKTITSVTGPIEDARPFSNNTVNVGFTPQFVFFETSCSPRPRPTITVVPSGAGRLVVTVTTTTNTSTPTNTFQRLSFGNLTNGVIDIPGAVSGGGSGLVVPLPPGLGQISFAIRRVTAGQVTTVPYTVTDACGDWPSFAGGGPNAF